MVKFILNNKDVRTDMPPGLPLLDFIRYHQHLTGTKIGCREGDCGACAVLLGELKNNEVYYFSCTSCLTPLGNVHNKHVVTIEGVNSHNLNPIQQAMADESATQCGFCTPGFVVSLAGLCLSRKAATQQNAIAAVDGNICRCTGYKSIERAATKITQLLQERKEEEPATFAVKQQILPEYFLTIRDRLKALSLQANGFVNPKVGNVQFIGGGTDLYVQKHDEMQQSANRFLFDKPELKSIHTDGNKCVIGASVTASELGDSAIIKELFPNFQEYLCLIASTPIRNIATLAGNLVNASPIGDFTIILLALNAVLVVRDKDKTRELPLEQFYRGYKTLNKKTGEYVEKFWFDIPCKHTKFNFEKVSKRTNLDIASVNSAINITTEDEIITDVTISAGGVGPIPMVLRKTSDFLNGKTMDEEVIAQATDIAQTEIKPISDARGSETYKRLLLRQLIRTHFITLFPELSWKV
ncbi:MAG: FAD binding domain-containing protein [Flavisolibacter sp.]|nr:FAD binding domain-containing protein [Flavisolibacter sp.]